MTKKRLVALLMVCVLICSSCGNDSKHDSKSIPTGTVTTTTATDTDTTGTDTTGTDTTGTTEERAISTELDDEFEGKFGRFKVSRDWGYASASINTTGDTSYFYLAEEENYPFLMYQYEIAEGLDTLSEHDWNQIAKNAGGKRLSDRTIDNRKFARIVIKSPEDNMKMMIYYTFEKQVLQGIAVVYSIDDADEGYLDLLEKVVETFEVDSKILEEMSVGDGLSSSAATEFTTASSTESADGYRAFEVKGGILSLPAEYVERTSDASNGDMRSYSNADRDKLILYQYIDLGITEDSYALGILDESFIDETIRLYALGISAQLNDPKMVGDKELYEFVPYPGNTDKLTGYIHVDRKKGILRIIMMSDKDMEFERIPEVLEFVQDLFVRFKPD